MASTVINGKLATPPAAGESFAPIDPWSVGLAAPHALGAYKSDGDGTLL
jgi:hypothetical protein